MSAPDGCVIGEHDLLFGLKAHEQNLVAIGHVREHLIDLSARKRKTPDVLFPNDHPSRLEQAYHGGTFHRREYDYYTTLKRLCPRNPIVYYG